MSRTLTRDLTRTLTALALAGSLAACGSSEDTAAVAAASPTVAAPSEAAASAAPDAAECPITAKEVPAPSGASTDLTKAPVVAPNTAPVPAEVTYADVVEGDGDEAVTGSQVEVKYVGAFYDTGKEFDSSWSRGPEEVIPFGICQQGVIPGFAVGPTGMKVGGRRLITIPSAFGYGAEGQPPTIPGGAALVFVVDLVKVTS